MSRSENGHMRERGDRKKRPEFSNLMDMKKYDAANDQQNYIQLLIYLLHFDYARMSTIKILWND